MTVRLLHKHALERRGPGPQAPFLQEAPTRTWSSAVASIGPIGAKPMHKIAAKGEVRRAKIWELAANLHCSIIGTCLSAGELRVLLRKFTDACDAASDHDLHQVAVEAAGQRGMVAKQIQKALDRRHRSAIARFAKAGTAEDLRRCWDEAVQAGEIPGAYWAILTHPASTDAVARRAFGAVHMLSHLVGAANRADIRRLHQLETDKAALEDTVARQHAHLRDTIVARDTRIRELSAALSAEIEQRVSRASEGAQAPDPAMLDTLVADLRKQLDGALRRRERAEGRAQEITAAHAKSERARLSLEQELAALRGELAAAEHRLSETSAPEDAAVADADLSGVTLLYVGGRPPQIARMRLLVEQASGQLLHHDGGIEERTDLLAGLVSRADAAFMPVDCVSHEAAQALKRLCRQAGKPFVPLRSSGIASLLHALRSPELGLASLRPA